MFHPSVWVFPIDLSSIVEWYIYQAECTVVLFLVYCRGKTCWGKENLMEFSFFASDFSICLLAIFFLWLMFFFCLFAFCLNYY